MTIKGTLETFNLRELLQMLAFNQKVGTLVLETVHGAQTIHVDKGLVAFVDGDLRASHALARVLRRRQLVREDQLNRAVQLHEPSGAYLGDILRELGAVEETVLHTAINHAVAERFLSIQLTAVARFEFVDGQVLAPDGTDHWPDGRPRTRIEPGLVVESLLLDLTRKMDQWVELQQVVPTMTEIYEGTGLSVDLEEALDEEEVDTGAAELVIASINGYGTLEQVVQQSDVDELTVLQLVATLVQGGGVRPVATADLLSRGEDLLTRGDPHRALPLLGRVVERGDAPAEARLHLADALELTGNLREAADQLDVYAERADAGKPLAIFDAIHRALELRENDLATAARLCDFFLTNRPWLLDRRTPAVEALRALIQGAGSVGQPLDAAERLHQFIQNGDVPNEDLLVLADLYADGGNRVEASAALFRRADALLLHGRTPQARDLLRRSLHLDPSRADARSRMHIIDGEQRRRRHRHRVTLSLVVTALLILGVGAAWWTYNQEAGRAIHRVQERAERAVDVVVRESGLQCDSFAFRLKEAREGSEPDEGLGAAAQDLLDDVEESAANAHEALVALAKEVDRYEATGHGKESGSVLRGLESKLDRAKTKVTGLIKAVRDEALHELTTGKEAYTAGRFAEARRHLEVAHKLAFHSENDAKHAGVLLGHVNAYFKGFEKAMATLETSRNRGDVVATWQQGVTILTDHLDSDLTRQVQLPVRLTSSPSGAEVLLGGARTGLFTPCVLEYSPFGATHLLLRMPGRVPHAFELPGFGEISDEPDKSRAWDPAFVAELPEGPRWRIDASHGPFRSVWASMNVALLLDEAGQALHPVRADIGVLGPSKAFRRHEPIRKGGSLGREVEWRIVGQRTLAIRPPTAEAWEIQALGHLERPPVLQDGTIVLVDERGEVYGYELSTGKRLWHKALGSPPAQDPLHGFANVLLTTIDGAAHAIKASSGAIERLASPGQGLLLALPLGDEIVLLGGNAHEVRSIARDSTTTRVGKADPSSPKAWIGPTAVAWIEKDGVHVLAKGQEVAHARGLGDGVIAISGDDGELYGIGTDGVLRAIRLDAPHQTAWRCKVREASTKACQPPLPLGDSVYVLVEGSLVAVAR